MTTRTIPRQGWARALGGALLLSAASLGASCAAEPSCEVVAEPNVLLLRGITFARADEAGVSEGFDLRSLYARLGDIVRAGGREWRLGLLVPDRQLAAQTRLKFESRLRTSNGGIGVGVELST